MRISYIAVAAVLASLWSLPNVHGAIVSGTHYTDGGKLVNLQGLEWLSWDETVGVSRTDIEAGWGGLIADGWRYATEGELALFFQSLSPAGDEGYHISNHDGSQWLWETFDNPDFTSGLYTSSRIGNLFAGVEVNSTTSYRAHYRAYDPPLTGGWFRDDLGRTHLQYTLLKSYTASPSSSTTIASVLVRDAAIPEPSTFIVFAGLFACFGIAGWWRKRKNAA